MGSCFLKAEGLLTLCSQRISNFYNTAPSSRLGCRSESFLAQPNIWKRNALFIISTRAISLHPPSHCRSQIFYGGADYKFLRLNSFNRSTAAGSAFSRERGLLKLSHLIWVCPWVGGLFETVMTTKLRCRVAGLMNKCCSLGNKLFFEEMYF